MSPNKLSLLAFFMIISLTSFYSCKKSDSNTPPIIDPISPVSIISLSTSAGAYDTEVVITGAGFNINATANQVAFNGKSATVYAATSTRLTVKVPKGAGTGPVTVTIKNVKINGPIFTYQYTATVSTFAGGEQAPIGSNLLDAPYAITTDNEGNVYVGDVGKNLIRKITSVGVISTLAGSGAKGSVDGAGAIASFGEVNGLVADAAKNIYVSDRTNRKIRKITPKGVVSTFAGNSEVFTGKTDGKGSAASFSNPGPITIDASGNLFILDDGSLRKVSPDGTVSTLPYNGAMLTMTAIAIDAKGDFYYAGGVDNKVYKSAAGGIISTFAGTGERGSANGIGAASSFTVVGGLAIDKSNNIIVSDVYDYQIRKINPAAEVSLLAGINPTTYPVINGAVSVATFYDPHGVAIDPSGIIYISETNDHAIRKISLE